MQQGNSYCLCHIYWQLENEQASNMCISAAFPQHDTYSLQMSIPVTHGYFHHRVSIWDPQHHHVWTASSPSMVGSEPKCIPLLSCRLLYTLQGEEGWLAHRLHLGESLATAKFLKFYHSMHMHTTCRGSRLVMSLPDLVGIPTMYRRWPW